MEFEQYLLETHAVDQEHLERAQRARRRSIPPIGTLAQERQLLSQEQVEAVLKHQRSRRQRFGETAVQMGMMSTGAVTSLLDLQRQRTPTMSETLVEMGAADERIYEWYLDWFQAHGPQALAARKAGSRRDAA